LIRGQTLEVGLEGQHIVDDLNDLSDVEVEQDAPPRTAANCSGFDDRSHLPRHQHALPRVFQEIPPPPKLA